VFDTTPPRVIEDEFGASPLQSAITDVRPRGNREMPRKESRSLLVSGVAPEICPSEGQPPTGHRNALRGIASTRLALFALSRWTTTSDRTERDQLLHRPGGPRVDLLRRGHQVDGATAPAGAGAAAAACEVLAQARSPAPRVSGRPRRSVLEATVGRKVRTPLLPVQRAGRTGPPGAWFGREPTVIWGPQQAPRANASDTTGRAGSAGDILLSSAVISTEPQRYGYPTPEGVMRNSAVRQVVGGGW
jgi:hypothetical protein